MMIIPQPAGAASAPAFPGASGVGLFEGFSWDS